MFRGAQLSFVGSLSIILSACFSALCISRGPVRPTGDPTKLPGIPLYGKVGVCQERNSVGSDSACAGSSGFLLEY